jgi:hypothetical protein
VGDVEAAHPHSQDPLPSCPADIFLDALAQSLAARRAGWLFGWGWRVCAPVRAAQRFAFSPPKRRTLALQLFAAPYVQCSYCSR